MKQVYEQDIQKVREEYDKAKDMRERIQFDPKRKLEQSCEKLHYWDGKVNGLEFALKTLGRHWKEGDT